MALGGERSLEVAVVRQVSAKVRVSSGIDHNQRRRAGSNPGGDSGAPFPPVGRQAVAFQERLQVAVSLQEITPLIATVERTLS
jgi:hypothetical protein